MTKVSWGIIGTGTIATAFAEGLGGSRLGRLAAVASRAKHSAEAFGGKFAVGAGHCHGSYGAIVEDATVEAVYVSTPHPMHAEWAVRCARAGKHVLCEKPLGMNAAEGESIINAAHESGVFLMEAFMYRCHPQTARVVELIRDGAIGEVKLVHATFSFKSAFDPAHRLWSKELGGGGILDVGCYPVSFSRLVAGAADGLPFMNPESLRGHGRLHPETGVDEYATASLEFPNGVLATVSCGIAVEQENTATVYGTRGRLRVPVPWAPARNGGESKMFLHREGREVEELRLETPQQIYGLEADVAAEGILAGRQQAVAPAMTWEDTLGNLETLERWLREVGVK